MSHGGPRRCSGPAPALSPAWLPACWSRRDLLRVGSLSLAAGASGLAAAVQGAERVSTRPQGSARSVILLNMMGGVTHLDSFDPKPAAAEEIRGTLAPIATRLPGVQFTEVMPRLASIADQLCVVRSFSHPSNDHLLSQAHVLSGRTVTQAQIMTEPNVGSIVARVEGPRGGLPGYVAVPGWARPGPPPHKLFVGGWLGGAFDPFAVGGEPAIPDFTATPKTTNPPAEFDESLFPPELIELAGLDAERMARRSTLRTALERQLSAIEERPEFTAYDGHFRNAIELLASRGIRGAFDLAGEPTAVRDAYGRTKLGGRCLLARRLVEAGARFVMVDYGYDHEYGNLWDNHNAAVQLFPHICEMARRGYHLAGLDRAFAALIEDLASRGLLDSTLVVFVTEFGRTPRINKQGGRDHWGAAGSIFFAGGGTRGGQVIGTTDAQGGWPLTPGYTPSDVAATIYRALGIDPAARLYDQQNRPHFILPEGEPIPGVLG